MDAPACYGPLIAAVIVYLYSGQFLSKERTAQALAELFGVPLSSGTVAALTARAAGKLGEFLEQARKQAGTCVAVAGTVASRRSGRSTVRGSSPTAVKSQIAWPKPMPDTVILGKYTSCSADRLIPGS